MKRIISLLLTLVLCFPQLFTPAAAVKNSPTKSEIQAKWNTVTSASTIFSTQPSVSAPYAPGKLTDEFLQSGITYLNFVRFVAGLPEVSLDETLNTDSQYGAVCLAAIDTLTHYPTQPEDMDDAFFNRAYEATTSSNISARWGYDPLTALQSAVSGCIDDNSSLGNLSTVGHRRWLLNPTLGKVGFGYARSAEDWDYIVTHVFDQSGSGCDYDFISWPVAGNHPTHLFDSENPWSITLNPDLYRTPSADSIRITLTRESDGMTWSFDSSTGQPTDSYHINPYMIVDTQWYAIPNCIIFHPGSYSVDSYEGIFTVEVTGLYTKSGSAASLRYQVDFFDIDECDHAYRDYKCIHCGELKPTPFQDVENGSFYHIPVLWAVDNGITQGISATEFGSLTACNRAQAVTFLWRAAGEPKPESSVNPFVDVEKGSFYEQAVLWAVEKGITTGTDATHFSPKVPCSRASIVTFLWRAAGKPAASGKLPFTDVPADSWYAAPVLWAVENNITNGISATKFGSTAACNRAQVVTFLYRTFA